MHPEFREFSDERVDAAVVRALEEVDLPPSYRITIRSLVRSRSQDWRTCCGGTCSPCIGRIEEAVDRARVILGSTDASVEHEGAGPPEVEPIAKHARRGGPSPPLIQTSPGPPDSSSPKDSSEDEDAVERNWGMDYA